MKRIFINSQAEPEVLSIASSVLAAGGLIIFPTETTYGVGVDATNARAVERLLAYKSRREGKPLSIAVADQAMAEQYVEVNEQAASAYAQFLPGPVTVVSKDLGVVAPGVASEFGTLGIRIPDYPLILKLVGQFGKPITATSANASGGKRPYNVDELLADLRPKQRALIDLILDAGTLPPNPPSLVIDTTLSAPVVLRERETHARAASTTLISDDPTTTRRIAGTFVLKHWDGLKDRGLVIGLDGKLGAGKTVFAKGVAEFLGVSESLASPTYTYIESYEFSRHGFTGTLHHCDFWKIGSETELEALEVASLIRPGRLVIIEWWQQTAEWLEPLVERASAEFVHVELSENPGGSDQERTIVITE